MPKDLLTITKVEKRGKKITIFFEAEGRWNDFIDEFSIENTYSEDIGSVPDSIAVIPALCNLLPMAWVYDLAIKVKDIDKVFYESIPNILNGYKDMYKDMKFGGEIIAEKIVKNKNLGMQQAGVLYSGGVDATTTVYRHLQESPDIITVLGSDIKLSDLEGIAKVNKNNRAFAREHNLKYESIYSTFRSFLKESGKALSDTEELKSRGHGWWHEFQHGIGLIGLVAPLSYIRGYKTVYIASSYHVSQKGKYTCASDPTIDNELRYSNTNTYHDGYELTRQDKIRFICNFAKEHDLKPYLRVCWESSGGENCCHCEKCRRTCLAIIAEKHDPADYGLKLSDLAYKRMIKWYKRHLVYKYDRAGYLRYKPIQDAFNSNWSEQETPKELKWFRDVAICSKKLPFYTKYVDLARRKLNIE